MDKNKVDLFIASNSDKFEAPALLSVRDTLEKMTDDQFMAISATEYRNPTVILLIAIFLGWERFWLDDVGMGVLKILTCYGLGIWWLVDLFTAIDRAKRYNFRKFMQTASLMR